MSKLLSSDWDTISSTDLPSLFFPAMEYPALGNFMQVPSVTLLLDGEFHRVGDDLVIVGPGGEQFTLGGYFASATLPTLMTADGRFLLPETVTLLLVPDPAAAGMVMVAGPTVVGEGVDAIGRVSQVAGKVTVKSKSGVTRTLGVGDPVFQEDVIKTEDGGLLKLTFKDDTSFQLGAAANLVLNKYVYNPGAAQGGFEATVLRGAFKYASGDIAHLSAGRHSVVKTPTATIGIRGSELQGEVTADGQTTVVHVSGILEVSDAQGMGTVTLLQPGMATVITFGASPQPAFKAPQEILDRLNGQLPPMLPGNKSDALGDGDAFGKPSWSDTYKSAMAALESRVPGVLNIKLAGLDLERMPEAQRQEFKHDLGELQNLLPPRPVEPKLFYGVFLDGPVAGITYKTGSKSGLTGAGGQFPFTVGDTVTFSIGDIELGKARMDQVGGGSTMITPKVLAAAATSGTDQKAMQSNIVRLLQTLDSDGDPNNGITITAIAQKKAVGDAAKNIDVTKSEGNFARDKQLLSFLTAAKEGTEQAVVLVNRDLAWERYGSTMDKSVEGITYKTASKTGLTAVGGQFSFTAGETVTFSIGNIKLAQVKMDQGESATVTAKLLVTAATNGMAESAAIPIKSNLIRLLQTLDQDGDPSNGIVINQTAREQAAGETAKLIDITKSEEDFAQNTDLTAVLVAAKGVALVDPDVAWQHYEQTLSIVEDLMKNVSVQSASFLFAVEDKGFSFELDKSTFQQDGGSALTYSIAVTSGTTTTLPKWLSFSAETLTLKGTPENADVGSINFKVTATSSNAVSGSVNYVLTVGNINDAPVVSPLADHAVPLGQALSLTLPAFTDVDVGDVLTYSVTANGAALPAWLHFDGATRTFTGTTAEASKYLIVVTATDRSGAKVSDDFVLKFQDPRAPEQKLDLPQQPVLLEDQSFVFVIPPGTFVDPTGDAFVVYSATLSGGAPLPGWLSVSREGRFSGTPGNADVGKVSLTVIATDVDSNKGFADFSLTVQNVNDAPVATAIAPQAVLLGGALRLSFAAFSDVDVGDKLTYAATLENGTPDGASLPSWLSFDSSTRTFTSSTLKDAGQWVIKVAATDLAGARSATSFTLTVDTPPTVASALADQTATEKQEFRFVVPTDVFHDPDVWDALTYTALSGGAGLPAWLKFDAASRTFSGTPKNSDVSDFNVQVTATDQSGASVAKGFFLTVANVNDAPTLNVAIPDQKAAINTPLYLQLLANTFVDIDAGDSLVLTATLESGAALPQWLTFDPATRTFTGTPGEADQAALDIKVTAQDKAGAIASDTFNMIVGRVNSAPKLTKELPPQIATQDKPFTFVWDAGTFQDADGDVLTYSAQLSGGAKLPAWLRFNGETRTFTGQPDNAAVGQLNIKVTATDPSGASAAGLLLLDVANVNDAPTVVHPLTSQLAPQGTLFTMNATGAFYDVDLDIPGGKEQLSYRATLQDGTALPAWLKFDPLTLKLSGTPGEEDVGFLLGVRITATDAGKASVADNFLILVTPPNHAPVLAQDIASKIATEDALFLYEIPKATFTDLDAGDVLTLSATLADGKALPAWLTFDGSTRSFVGTPGNADVAQPLTFRVTVADFVGAKAESNNFTITVANVNDAPVLAVPVPDRQVFRGAAPSPVEPFEFKLPVGTFTDEDVGDVLTYSATLVNGSPLPAWINLDASTGLLSGGGDGASLGTLNVKITATDKSGAKVVDVFSVTVRTHNTPPTLTAGKKLADQTAQEDLPFTLKLDKETFKDADPGDVLTWTAALSGGVKWPSWLVFDGATQTFSGVAKNADVGDLVVVVKATDKDGAEVADQFKLTVANTNDAPVLAKPIPDQKAVRGSPFTYKVDAATFTDEDPGSVLALTATLASGAALPSWLSFDAATRTFASANPSTLETLSIKVVATDNGPEPLLSAAAIFNLTVALPNTAPTTKGISAPGHATQDRSFVLRLPADTFQDADVGDRLTLSATLSDGRALPAWLTFDPGTKAFIGTPKNADVGTLDVTVTAADTASARVSATFKLVVDNVNDAPVLTAAIADQIAVNGQKFQSRLAPSTFTDPDVGDTLTLSAKLVNGSPWPSWLTFDASSGTLSGTPAADGSNMGSLAIKVTATDKGGLQASSVFNLQVLPPNAAPTVQQPIGAQAAVEKQFFGFQVPSKTFVDADGDLLKLTATRADGLALPAWLIFDSDIGAFSGRPGNGDVGSLNLLVTATDPRGRSVSNLFTLTVANVNDAPTLDLTHPIAAQSATQGVRFNFRVPGDRFVDMDAGDTLAYVAKLSGGADLPAWLTFNQTTNVFGGTPTAQDVGTLSIRLTATDSGGLSVSDAFSIRVLPPNTAPTVKNSLGKQSVAEKSAFTWQVPSATFEDVDPGDTLTYAAATLTGDGKLPGWLHFDAATRTFFGTPDNDAVADVKIKVIATDSREATDFSVFELKVTNVNDAPVLKKAIGEQRAPRAAAFKLQLDAGTFLDPDKGDVLKLTAATLSGDGKLPGWLTFDPETYSFGGTPGAGDVTTVVKVTATDVAGAKAFDIFTLRVTEPNQAPVLANPVANREVLQGQVLSLQFAANTFTDADGDALTYRATGLADGSALPTWLSFDADTRTLVGKPGNVDVGTLGIKLIATDPFGASSANTFNIKVVNVNDAPTVTQPLRNQSVVKGAQLKYQFAADTFTDVDVGDKLTFTATDLVSGKSLPAWLQFDSATRTFSGTPGPGDVGVVNVKVTASDGQASVADTFRIQVAESQSGILLDSKVIGVTYKTATHTGLTDANGAFQFQPGETVTFSIGGIVLGQVKGGSIITPMELSGSGNVPTVTNMLRLLQTLDADGKPDNGIEITAAARDQAANVTLDFNVSEASFAANQTLSGYLQTIAGKPALVATESAWKHFIGTLTNVASTGGTEGILTTSAASPVSVAIEDTAFSYKLPATAFGDLDRSTPLTYSVAPLDSGAKLPKWLAFDKETGLFSGTPSNDDVGTLALVVTATGAKKASSQELVDLTVLNSNDAPILKTAITDQNATRAVSFFFQVPTNTFADVDVVHGDRLKLTATQADGSALPTWLAFDADTGSFSGKPGSLATTIVKVTASDLSGASVSSLFNLNVVDVNNAPELKTGIAQQTVPKATQDQPFRFQLAVDTFVDRDAGDTLTYSAALPGGSGSGSASGVGSVKTLPDWLKFDPDTRTFSGTPTQKDVGTLNIKVTATDAAGKTVADTLLVKVEDRSDAPMLAKAIDSQFADLVAKQGGATQGVPFRFVLDAGTFVDVDPGDRLTLTAKQADGKELPSWLIFDGSTGTFSGIPQSAGAVNIQVTATDPTKLSAAGSFALAVQAVNHAPTLKAETLSVPDLAEGTPFRYQLPVGHFVDADGDVLKLSAQSLFGSLPSWLRFDADTGSFSGTPDAVGVWGIKVTAQDSAKAQVSDTFNLSVKAVNHAPLVKIPPANQIATLGKLFSLQIADGAFTDQDAGDILTYTMIATVGKAGASWLNFDADTRTFIGLPAASDVGVVDVKVTAKDRGNLSVSSAFTITVAKVNHAPERDSAVLLPGQKVNEGTFFSFSLPSGVFKDEDSGDTLSLNATNLLPGVALPKWLVFDADTGTFSGKPSRGDVGDLGIKLTAVDAAGLKISDTFSIKVQAVNKAPILNTPLVDQNTVVDQPFQFKLGQGVFSDPDAGDTLSFSAKLASGEALPGWLSFDSSARAFTGQPTDKDAGVFDVVVTATDNAPSPLAVSDIFRLTVAHINHAPTLVNLVGVQTVKQGQLLNFRVPTNTFADVDVVAGRDKLTVTAGGVSADGKLPAWLSFDKDTGTFSGKPGNSDVGSFDVKLQAIDSQGEKVVTSFVMKVDNVNDVPVLTKPVPNQDAAIGKSFVLRLPGDTFTDVDVGDVLTFSATATDATGLPTWLNFDPVGRIFSGTPTVLGALGLKVSVADVSGATASTVFQINVVDPNHRPVLANPLTDTVATEKQAFRLQFASTTFLDQDTASGDVLSYSAELLQGGALPSWLAFDSSTRSFSGVPSNADVGVLGIKVTATDQSGAKAFGSFSLTVANVNDAPTVVRGLSDRVVTEGVAFRWQVPSDTFLDVDKGSVLSYKASLSGTATSWLTFDPVTLTFSGTPGKTDVGVIGVTVTATDNDPAPLSAATGFTMRVNAINHAPVLGQAIVDQKSTQDVPFSFSIKQAFADEDVVRGDVLTLSAASVGATTLPAWLKFDPDTGLFSGKPGNQDVGSYTVKATATDKSGLAASGVFVIQVANVNDAPVLKTPVGSGKVARTNVPFELKLSPTMFQDPDVGDTLVYSVVGQTFSGKAGGTSDWLTFDRDTLTFRGTPQSGDVGAVSVTLQVADSDPVKPLKAFDSFVIQVESFNTPPVASVTPIAKQTATQGQAFAFALPTGTFTDLDGYGTLTLTVSTLEGADLPAWLSFSKSTGAFSGTPGNADVGTISVKVTATDSGGLKAFKLLTVDVANVNDAPVLVTPLTNQAIVAEQGLNVLIPAQTFQDPDVGDRLAMTATRADGSSLPSWLNFSPSTLSLTGVPSNVDAGVLAIKMTATDQGGLSATSTFNLTVTPINHAPTLGVPIGPQVAAEDSVFSYQILPAVFVDQDVGVVGDRLKFDAVRLDGTPLPAWLSFDKEKGLFSGTPVNGDVGALGIKVTATDLAGAKAFDTFVLTVNNVNDAPVVAKALTGKIANLNTIFTFQVPKETFFDEDVGGSLTLSAKLAGGADLPSWLRFDASTGIFSGKPAVADLRTYAVQVIATDGSGASVVAPFELQARNPNLPPRQDKLIADQTIAEDALFSFQFAADTFVDPNPSDTLTFTAVQVDGSALPSWLAFDAATRTFSGKPLNENVGTTYVKVVASDGQATAVGSFAILVNNVNDAPTLVTHVIDQAVSEGDLFRLSLPPAMFRDEDVGDTLAWSVTRGDGSKLPDWLTYNSSTGMLSGTPSLGDVGTVSVKIAVTDSGALSAADIFAIKVAAINHAPTLGTAIGSQAATEDQAFSFHVPATTFVEKDPGDVLTLQATRLDNTPLPSWLAFDGKTGLFSGTPLNGDVGSLAIKVTASDLAGAKAFDTFVLEVTNTNDAPTFSQALGNQAATQGSVFSFTVPAGIATDVDVGDVRTYSATIGGGTSASWLKFDNRTLTFSGLPGNADVGATPVTLTVTDSAGAKAVANFVVNVANVNDWPVLVTPIPDQKIFENKISSFVFGADAFGDVDVGDVLTYTATVADGTSLPGWLTFDAASRTFTSTVSPNVQDIVLRMTATDKDGTFVSDQFDVDVIWGVTLTLTDTTNGLSGMDKDGVTSSGVLTAVTKGRLEYNLDDDGWRTVYAPPLRDGTDDGLHTVQVRQMDADGNVLFNEPDVSFVLDTVPPVLPNAMLDDTTNGLLGGDADRVSRSGVIVAPTNIEAGAVLEYSLNGGTSWSTGYAAPTTDGAHTVLMRQTDAAGNISSNQTLSFVLDTTLPAVPNASVFDSTNGLTGNNVDRVTVSGALTAPTNIEAGAVVEYSLNNGVSWSRNYVEPVVDGAYKVLVRQTDVAGNVSSAQEVGFTLDTTSPVRPDAVLSDTTNGLAGNDRDGVTTTGTLTVPTNIETGAVVEYRVDNGTWIPSYVAPTTDGVHTVLVRQTDAAGNISSGQSLRFTLDTALPATPNAVWDDTTNGIAGGGTDGVTRSGVIVAPTNTETGALVGYSLDNGVSWSTGYVAPTTGGAYTVLVRQTDAAGNVSAKQTISLHLDIAPPAIPNASLDDTTNGLTGNNVDGRTKNSAVFVVPTNTETGAVLEYNLDDGGWGTTFTPLPSGGTADGVHTLFLRQTDVAGNVSGEQKVSFLLDTVAPVAPNALLDDTTNGLTGNETDGRSKTGVITAPTNAEAGALVEYSVNGGSSWGTGYTVPATDGTYTVMVRQTDAAGTVSPSQTIGFVLDTVAPVVTVTSAVSDNTIPTQALVGDRVTVSFTTDGSESGMPTATIMGHSASVIHISGNSYTATYVANSGETSTSVTFAVSAVDASGNVATPVTAVTSSAPYAGLRVSGAWSTSYPILDQESGVQQSDNVSADNIQGVTVGWTMLHVQSSTDSLSVLDAGHNGQINASDISSYVQVRVEPCQGGAAIVHVLPDLLRSDVVAQDLAGGHSGLVGVDGGLVVGEVYNGIDAGPGGDMSLGKSGDDILFWDGTELRAGGGGTDAVELHVVGPTLEMTTPFSNDVAGITGMGLSGNGGSVLPLDLGDLLISAGHVGQLMASGLDETNTKMDRVLEVGGAVVVDGSKGAADVVDYLTSSADSCVHCDVTGLHALLVDTNVALPFVH